MVYGQILSKHCQGQHAIKYSSAVIKVDHNEAFGGARLSISGMEK